MSSDQPQDLKTPVTPHILIVDDDVELCHVISDTLKERGYRTTFVENAEDALEKIQNDRSFSLILLDLEIPHMGGLVLCQKLKEHPEVKNIPVVFLTVRDSDFDKKTAMSLGASRYITKPFRRSHLIKEIDALIYTDKASQPAAETSADAGGAAGQATSGSSSSPASSSSSASGAPGSIPSSAPASTPPERKEAVYKTFESFRGIAKPATDSIWEWARKNKKVAIIVGGLSVIILTTGLYKSSRWLWGLKDKVKKVAGAVEGNVTVNVMQIAPAPFQDTLAAVGTVAGGSEIELRFQTEGNLRTLNFREGDAVRAGQIIATLDQNQTSIKLERAKSEYFRYEKLYALGGVSKDRLEEAKVQYEYAKSELDKTILRARQDGILGDRGVEVGEFITPQKKVGTLVSLNTVLIRIGVIEKEIDKIYPCQPVTATVDTYPNVEFKGKIENLSPLVQGQSKTLTIEARMPNEGKLLLPGMFARTRIVIYEKEDVIAVPNDSLEKTQAGYQVYVVGKETKAEVRPVEVSYVSLTHSVISSGLTAGDQVIVQKPQELKEGSPLKVIEFDKAAPGMEGGAGMPGADGMSGAE